MDAEEPTSETHRTAWNIRMGHHVREFVFGAHTYIWARTRLLCWRLTNGFGTGENKSLLSKFKLLFNPYPPSGGQFVRAESAADDECRWIVVCFCGLNTGNYHNEIAILQTELYRDSLGAAPHVDVCGRAILHSRLITSSLNSSTHWGTSMPVGLSVKWNGIFFTLLLQTVCWCLVNNNPHAWQILEDRAERPIHHGSMICKIRNVFEWQKTLPISLDMDNNNNTFVHWIWKTFRKGRVNKFPALLLRLHQQQRTTFFSLRLLSR